jgi:hypothetical protein
MKEHAKGNAGPEDKGWRTLSILSVLFLMMSCLISCGHFFGSFLEIPRPAAVNALTTTRKWGEREIAGYTRSKLLDKGVRGLEQCGYGPMEAWRPAGTNATSSGEEFLEILHLSDAHIRDAHILRRSDYRLNDLILKDTLRLELIENLDSLLLAAVLRGYRNEIASYHSSRQRGVLAVFTGDLLDLSLVTEMIDGAAAVNYACKKHAPNPPSLPFLQVPGNHDGFTFGNIEDKNSTTWELGLNQLEFSLASLELLANDPKHECEAKNEALTELLKKNFKNHKGKPELEGAPEFSKRLKERGNWAGPDVLHYVPVALKGRVNVDKTEVDALQPGYFSVVRNGFRIICLDTRCKPLWKVWGKGNVGLVQLGWLYQELKESLAERQPVLIFAHHPPSDYIRPPKGTGKALKNMIWSFPHVLGYFYGHQHKPELEVKCEKNVWFVQAPSLVDFPMGALVVRVEGQKDSNDSTNYRLNVEHVKTRPDRSKGAGLVLDGLQDEALVYAAYDVRKLKELKYSQRISKDPDPFSKSIRWNDPCPEPQKALANNDLVKSITEERKRLLNEEGESWYGPKPHPQKVSQSRE